MDPVGAGLVVKEYFDFLHIGFMAPASKVFGVTLALAETLVGAAMACGVWRRIVGVIAIIMQSAFTLITLALLIFNPEMDCGCFGEAIHLTHLQTFIKNLILLALVIIYFLPNRHLGIRRKKNFVSFGLVSISAIAFMIYSLLYIPLINFTAYKPGAELLVASTQGGDDIYEAIFTYQKDGKKKDFRLDELPDSTWTFISTETRLKEGIKENTIELSIFDPKIQSHVDTIAAKGKVIVISVYDPDLSGNVWKEVEMMARNSEDCGFKAILLTTESEAIPATLQDITYTSDYKTLVSLNRSNGGATYFCDGTLIKKWARRSLPSVEELKDAFTDDPTEISISYESKGSLVFQGFLCFLISILLLI